MLWNFKLKIALKPVNFRNTRLPFSVFKLCMHDKKQSIFEECCFSIYYDAKAHVGSFLYKSWNKYGAIGQKITWKDSEMSYEKWNLVK